MGRYLAVLGVGFTIALAVAIGCDRDESTDSRGPEPVSSLSYKGHENDADSNGLIAVYPAAAASRVDDCRTCHRGGEVVDDGERTLELNPCSYCHLVPYPDASIVSGAPGSYENTLNPFGLDYGWAGRSTQALRDIRNLDSDGDGFANTAELAELRYPGDPGSKPGQPIVPVRTITRDEIVTREVHEQFLLMNSHTQRSDFYATYRGVTVENLLTAAGADLGSATTVTFIAPDGYARDFEIDAIRKAYPPGLYCANLDSGSFGDPDQGFVTYPGEEHIPGDLVDGGTIPGEARLMIAYGRDGSELDQAHLDPTSVRLEGEGPYRLVVPPTSPGAPDRGSSYSPSGYEDGHDYDDARDHNAGPSIRAVVAIRVNPMPEGYEEFDWKNGGWSLVERKQLIIYGAGITGN